MPTNPYKTLPLESLYELLTESVRNMLDAFESEDDYNIAFKPLKKQVELLIAAIEEKRIKNAEKN